ncbi:DNA pol B 2 domain-containing protein [Aphis craccivora]|uniref:DNA pol B 2 domain-containing protein n=1 Tax=Aphis craccivora TaxID=307492 RepID=A0A6G0Y6H4_APHCR|nr:DNA pol B 2 domain-containing protein [Aphis craccivora]
MKKNSVIPNSEEKFISFSKHVSNNFSIRFIDTLRFMASSLSTLLENLLTPEFEKFRETAKHFNAKDLPLVTRKGVVTERDPPHGNGAALRDHFSL